LPGRLRCGAPTGRIFLRTGKKKRLQVTME
jgi:hypothetical protein